jgi:hypothetical protein
VTGRRGEPHTPNQALQQMARHVGSSRFVAHSAPAAAELGRSAEGEKRLLVWVLLIHVFLVSMWLSQVGCRRWWPTASEADRMAVATVLALLVSLAGGVALAVWW